MLIVSLSKIAGRGTNLAVVSNHTSATSFVPPIEANGAFHSDLDLTVNIILAMRQSARLGLVLERHGCQQALNSGHPCPCGVTGHSYFLV